ncbi:MAG TPA: AraC family transcriptional regulator [Rhodocyclaceae bacterium]|nr:AraC family transcriptional regulator [Rhodocyclaceae bacterium]
MSDSPEDDLLSSILNAYQLRAGVYGNPRLCGAWQMGTSGHKRAAFHIIGRGQCWLHLHDSVAPQALQGGDIVVFPHDAWHMLSGAPELAGEDNVMPSADEGPFTTLVCGYFEFQVGDKNPILDALPEVIIVRREDAGRPLELIGQLLIDEARSEAIGTRTVLDKLTDTLFVMVVRQYISGLADQRGLLAALADPRLRKALAIIHREPATAWTLDSLAQIAGMSRASFAQRFSELVGTSPIEYLTRWRMTQAELLLRNPQVSVAAVAERVGYETEAAFRKAFKRVHGVGPGSIRRWFRRKLSVQD